MRIKISLILIVSLFITTHLFAGTNARGLFEKADRLYLEASYEACLYQCRALLRRFKTSSLKDDAAYLAGLSLLKLARYSEARNYFKKVINQKPESSLKETAGIGLADTYFLEKNYSKAGELYRSVLAEFPDTDFSDTIDSRLEKMGKTDYTVQIGSFKKKSNANKLYRKFKKQGYSTYVFRDRENGKTLYKVRIGKFNSEKRAKGFAGKLQKQGYETKICAW